MNDAQRIPYALRGLRREPAFAAMVVFSLAVGIGANTAIFSLVDGVLLRPPAYRDPERLAALSQVIPKFLKAYPALPVNLGILWEWRNQVTSFESVGAARTASFTLTGTGEPELLRGARVTANMFAVLGVQPHLGPGFLESEEPAGHDLVVILADSLWRRRFSADPAIIGRKILLDGRPCEVVGVLPPSFRFPREEKTAALALGEGSEIFRPLGYESDDLGVRLGDFNYWAVARLRPGVTLAQARAEMNVVQAGISAKIPEKIDLHAGVVPLQERMVGDVRRGLVLLMSAVGAVLLVLCINQANLSLARAAGQARNSAIRTALGAGRARLVRQSLAGSLLLAFAGGALGVLLAYAGLRALLAAAPVDLPRLYEVGIDLRVLLFAVAISLATGLIFGIFPALPSATAAPYEALKSGSHTNTEGRRGMRLRNTLVGMEVGLGPALRRAVWDVDSEVPVPEVRTLEQVMARSVAERRFQMLLVLLFAAAALALAAFGTYGVVSYSRRVIGWHLDDGLDDSLTLAALRMALRARPVRPGLAHHSDRGVQYASGDYTDLLKANGIDISMSRKANPWDNAACESFMKTLKYEEVYRTEYRNLVHARAAIGEFLERVYNEKRLPSALDYRSPVQFERTLVMRTEPEAARVWA